MLENETKLPTLNLSDSQKLKCERIMRRGNVVLKRWHKKALKKLYTKRIAEWQKSKKSDEKPKVPKYSRSKFRAEIFGKIKSDKATVVCVRGFRIPRSDIEKILSVRKIEWELFCGFSGLITNHAEKWSHNRKHLDFDDLYNEGAVALLDAIYQYTHRRAKFITFAWWSIHRRMIKLVTKNDSPLSWTAEASHLHHLYEQTKTDFNGPATFDEVAESMEITKEQRTVLVSLLQKVVRQSTLDGLFDQFDEDRVLDYSALSIDLGPNYRVAGRRSNSSPIYRKDEDDNFEPDVVEDVGVAAERVRAKLDDWETKVLDAFLEGSWGWAAKIARQSTNPKTGKCYSRMAPNIALERIKEMILAEYAEILEQNLEAA